MLPSVLLKISSLHFFGLQDMLFSLDHVIYVMRALFHKVRAAESQSETTVKLGRIKN